MAQAAAVVINNGSAVAKTFNPERVTPELTVLSERTTGISLAYPRLKMTFSPATANRATNRSSFSVEIPITQVVDGVTSVAFTLRGKLELILPDGCTDAQRLDLYAFLTNGMANTLIRGNLRDLDPLY